MKLIRTTFCLAALCATGLGASSGQSETKSKVTVKDGKEMTVTGCVQPTGSGNGYMLTNVADKKGSVHNYMLVSHDEDFSKHVGHRMELSGKVTDRGDAKIEVDTKTKTKVEHGDDQKTHSKSEMKGDMAGVPYFGVKSMKMIAAACP
jgi:hypothetical protein